MKIVEVCDVEIPIIEEGNVGIAVSGGADSALLLYILMNHLSKNQKLFVYTLAKSPTFYSSAVYSNKVINYCIDNLNFKNIEHNIRYLENQTHDILYEPMLEDFNNNKISKFYSAVTANPPKKIADSFCGSESNVCHNDRNPEIYRDIFRGNHSVTPFTNVDKKKINEMYKSLELFDLFNLTKSCESYEIEYKNTHCGKCWWCKEREWGFGKL